MSLTRLGPSRLVPGAKGVFLTRPVKKFVPIEVEPPPHAIAPPYMENLIHAPRHTVSLRRFLALRHQFSTGMYFNIATSSGWYLLVPGGHAPLADGAALQAWRERHHHHYTHGTAKGGEREGALLQGMSGAVALGDDDKLSKAAQQRDTPGLRVPSSSAMGHVRPRATSPLVILEDHLFEINDGVLWETPPSDDLGSADYWKGHRERMQLYEDTSLTVDQVNLFTSPQTAAKDPEAVAALTEQERYAHQLRLFQALTRKANVRLHVDDATRLLTLMPIVNLSEGDELLLHYGREWWSQRLLSSLFMSVSDGEMRNVRWIESLFVAPTDVARPFPMLCSATWQRRKRGRTRTARIGEMAEQNGSLAGSATTVSGGVSKRLALYNVATRRRSTDAEALVFALRRSCLDEEFFSHLVGMRGAGVFDASRCDEEVPLCRVRRVLLQSLRQGRTTTPAHAPQGPKEVDDGSLTL